MAVLAQRPRERTAPCFSGPRRWLLAGIALGLLSLPARAEISPSREYQVKAVFLFNFTQFVDWPREAFSDPNAPLVIGVLGEDPFGNFLDDTLRGEKSGAHPLTVRRYRTVDEVAGCHILFVSQSMADRLEPTLAELKGQSVLTVGDSDSFARRGGMIRFVMINHKIRLRINLEATRAAGLTLSSKLLRPADIVNPGED